MKNIKVGPLVLAVLVLAVYLAFLSWYGGSGKKMTPAEKSLMFSRLVRNAGPGDTDVGDGRLMQHLRKLVESDDGREFYMLYLMQFRENAAVEGASADARLDADKRNNGRLAPMLLRHGNVPVFVGEPQGRFIDSEGDTQWQRVVMVRYRSTRDMLEMMAEVAGKPIGVLRWSEIQHQQVFPVHARFNLVFVRLMVGLLLAAFGYALHRLLRLSPAYRGVADEGDLGRAQLAAG